MTPYHRYLNERFARAHRSETLGEKCERLLRELRADKARRTGAGRFIEASEPKESHDGTQSES
jgi:hypothetical protein